jgi:hypothetical protein
MDNFFISVGLFEELASMQIYATSTMRANRIGLLLALKNTRAFRNIPQGTLDWRMHESWRLAVFYRRIRSSSYFFLLIQSPLAIIAWENIMTSPIHLEYTTYMQNLDVVDQLRASYNTQNCTHK